MAESSYHRLAEIPDPQPSRAMLPRGVRVAATYRQRARVEPLRSGPHQKTTPLLLLTGKWIHRLYRSQPWIQSQMGGCAQAPRATAARIVSPNESCYL